MKIESQAFSEGEMIPKKYTCEGMNVNPPLRFMDVPKEAKSLILLVEDPDASTVKPWVHWLVFNMTPSIGGLEEDSNSNRYVEGLSTGNIYGYEGPCPPSGTHHYHFRLFALNSVLNLNSGVDRKRVLNEIEGKIIATAVLTGLYKKQVVKQSA